MIYTDRLAPSGFPRLVGSLMWWNGEQRIELGVILHIDGQFDLWQIAVNQMDDLFDQT